MGRDLLVHQPETFGFNGASPVVADPGEFLRTEAGLTGLIHDGVEDVVSFGQALLGDELAGVLKGAGRLADLDGFGGDECGTASEGGQCGADFRRWSIEHDQAAAQGQHFMNALAILAFLPVES